MFIQSEPDKSFFRSVSSFFISVVVLHNLCVSSYCSHHALIRCQRSQIVRDEMFIQSIKQSFASVYRGRSVECRAAGRADGASTAAHAKRVKMRCERRKQRTTATSQLDPRHSSASPSSAEAATPHLTTPPKPTSLPIHCHTHTTSSRNGLEFRRVAPLTSGP